MKHMTWCRVSGVSAIVLSVLVSAGSALADPKGLWQAQDGAHVRAGPCGGALCATIVKPKSSVDPQTGLPWTDKNNPDPAHRGRPLIPAVGRDGFTTSTTAIATRDIFSRSTLAPSGSK